MGCRAIHGIDHCCLVKALIYVNIAVESNKVVSIVLSNLSSNISPTPVHVIQFCCDRGYERLNACLQKQLPIKTHVTTARC